LENETIIFVEIKETDFYNLCFNMLARLSKSKKQIFTVCVSTC